MVTGAKGVFGSEAMKSFNGGFLCLYFFLVCVWWSIVEGGKDSGKPHTPTNGWCKTKHRPKKAAQSGYCGYCKSCFREKFPKKYEDKQQRRKKLCFYCQDAKEIQSNGFCKPCTSARSCDQCASVNVDKEAQVCRSCAPRRGRQGAGQERLAIWCSSCHSQEERASGICCLFKRLTPVRRPLFVFWVSFGDFKICLLYTSPSPRDGLLSRMPSSA